MQSVKAVQRAFLGIFRYDGRAGRGEYWWFVLSCLVICALMVGVDLIVQGRDYRFGLADVAVVVLIVPLVAVGARRLHDAGRSGWWQLVALVPVFGVLLLIVWLAKPSDRGANAWGAAPAPLRRL